MAEGLVEDLVYVKGLVETGVIKPIIDKRCSLEDVAKALAYVETGRKKGNVVIPVE